MTQLPDRVDRLADCTLTVAAMQPYFAFGLCSSVINACTCVVDKLRTHCLGASQR